MVVDGSSLPGVRGGVKFTSQEAESISFWQAEENDRVSGMLPGSSALSFPEDRPIGHFALDSPLCF
jgi:hypothetical protein